MERCVIIIPWDPPRMRGAFSIATGLSFGVITYTIVKLAAGKYRDVSIVLWILTILFIVRDVYLAVG